MKRLTSTIIGMLGLVLVAAGAHAQSLKVKADIPFNFVVDKAALPAGSYSIDALSGSTGLVIRSNDSNESRVVLSNHAESFKASSDTHLTFHRYGDQYFLAQIWVEGEHAGRQLKVTGREREAAKNM